MISHQYLNSQKATHPPSGGIGHIVAIFQIIAALAGDQGFAEATGFQGRKYNLLPYETIVKATAGEPEAVNTVIQTYTGYIKYLSYFQGSINDDIQDYLKASLMEALPKFRFDR